MHIFGRTVTSNVFVLVKCRKPNENYIYIRKLYLKINLRSIVMPVDKDDGKSNCNIFEISLFQVRYAFLTRKRGQPLSLITLV